MKNVFFKLVTTAAAASLVLAALPVSADEEAKEIKVAVAGGFYPITYADDNGEAQGYDVEVFRPPLSGYRWQTSGSGRRRTA